MQLKRIEMLQCVPINLFLSDNAKVENCVMEVNQGEVEKDRDDAVKWKQKRKRER